MKGKMGLSVCFALLGFLFASCKTDQEPPSTGLDNTRAETEGLTFNRDIAPIVFHNCAPCHRPGQSGPFSLLSYRDVAKRAEQIVMVTQSRFMPPWRPDRAGNRFMNQRGLDKKEIRLLRQWTEQGRIEGRPEDLPEPPRWEEGWALGKPDLVFRMEESYELAAGGRDVYRNFVIPIPSEELRYVRALDLRPGNKRIVHHATMRIDRTLSSRDLDRLDSEPGFDSMIFSKAEIPDGFFLGWTPGKLPFKGYDDMAWRLEPGTDLVLQLHLQPSGKPERIQPVIGLYFADRPPSRSMMAIVLENKDIDIPAGAENHRVSAAYRLPVDVDAVSIYPHAHYLAKHTRVWATLPDQSRLPLIRIEDWDFNWQDEYRYAEPIFLPKGTIVSFDYVYDNSPQNIRNPFHPPQRIVYGGQSTDEMAELVLQVIPRDPKHLKLLMADYNRASLTRDLDYFLKKTLSAPRSALFAYETGLRYMQLGQREKAISFLETSLGLDPAQTEAHFNLGVLLGGKGLDAKAASHYREALKYNANHAEAHLNLGHLMDKGGHLSKATHHYREALRIKPGYALAYNNLGFIYARTNRLDEAILCYQKAVRADPQQALSHTNLAEALALRGLFSKAVTNFERALQLAPDDIHALTALSWILSTHTDPKLRNPKHGAVLAARACRLTNFREPLPLVRLAAASAALNQFPRALQLAEMALILPQTKQLQGLAGDIKRQMELYRRGETLKLGPGPRGQNEP